MGKKVKKKSRAPQKEKRVTNHTSKKVPQPSNPNVETADDGVSVVKEKKPCPHIEKGVDYSKLSAKFALPEPVRCEDCREGVVDRRAAKGKGKHGKKKGSGSVDSKSELKAIWVCLECGHFSCGGIGLPTSSQCHAVRHVRQTRHPLVIHFEKPQLRWCFPCNTLVTTEKVEENGETKDVFSDIVKLIKGHVSQTQESAVNVEDVWFGSGSVTTEIKSVSNVTSDLDGNAGYMVRGLVNLGNTCFFNSIMQNLLAMDRLRDYFLKLDLSAGPLTIALKKLFVETKPEAGVKNVVNPRSFFGCVCTKAPQFRGYQQHDSHELLRCLLDGLSTEELGFRKQMNSSEENENSSKGASSFVEAVFGGQVSSTVRCTECGHSSTVYEPFLDLSLPVPTKKPPSKKAQPTSRAKKTKLPPKKSGKNRPKLYKSADSISAPSTSNEVSCEPQSGSGGPSTVAEEKESVLQNFSAVQESVSELVFQDAAEQAPALLDDSTWMDYLDAETVTDGNNLTSQNTDISNVQDLENKDALKSEVPIQCGSESSTQVFSLNEEVDVKPETSSVNSWEDDVPLQVQSSEVLLLPYLETSMTMEPEEVEASSSNVGGGQEDFEGFGDLFNEPEVAAGPVAGPSLGDEVAETGFMAGNSSESDPDEVDDSDSPVSVESCLTHFTKPELLSNDNAWHCENCSKTLQQQKLEAMKKQLKTAPKSLTNGCVARIQSDMILDKDLSPADVRNLSNGNIKDAAEFKKPEIICSSQNSKTIENGQTDENNPLVSRGEDGIQEQSNASDCYNTSQESFGDQAIDSCVDESNDEISPKIVKVKRDATKRVFINKAPPILTIHLKRFSQDARGRLSKLNGHVKFREVIDLKPYMDARCIDEEKYDYRLVGVVEHLGTMRGGHYVAFIRGAEKSGGNAVKENVGSTWFHASDAYVRQTSLEEVLRCEAYILFYEKI
ncbi:hypothetical protein FEM48_Zijuj07G0067700 [Ziziphus jujuba var. spinosa]|uniref:Ubiquitin carboxyl-terminal hydrolase n=1 Tax=Ziziphus jujuba var. spinosa TaxID=714518 RepID=A0A978V338_ZIZJJ|nr:hypothetical protein FEM48_Zijuj07G0067700 [Ziziphus jujuba var. spinosa]